MRVHFEGRAFDYQTLRALGYTTYGGAEPGEVLVTVERVPEGETEAWHREWRATAERVERGAERAANEGNDRTARRAYLRAHTYFRTAEFFLGTTDPRRRPTYDRSVSCFRAGVERFETPVERFEVPYEDTALPGYAFLPEERELGPFPTVVCLGGFDSLGEELYFLCGVPEALARGYAVVLFEGPGQGRPLRANGLVARPDWEHVVGPVLDHLHGRPGLHSEGVALVGVSFGGYYAPRAAAFDDRIDACVAFDHMHDLLGAAAHENPRIARAFARLPDVVVNTASALAAGTSVDARWTMRNAKWVFGVDSAAELQRTLATYSLAGVAGDVTCPTLVLAGADDHFVPLGMAGEFADLLGGPTTVRVFSTEEGAGEHCQVGNLSLAHATIYDWLDRRGLTR
jgi:pimeloyl-ACP methyl ester carboxylesterase